MVCGKIYSSIIKESAEKSLTGHLFKYGNRLEEGVNAHKPEFRPDPCSCKDAWVSFGL